MRNSETSSLINDLHEDLCHQSISHSLKWKSAACTHIGRVRHINEDAFLESNEHGLWLVADGMGGHSRGDYASKSVVLALSHFIRQTTLAQNITDIEERLIKINHQCQNAFRGKRIGTTIALLFEFNGHCFYIWAGDSRIYRLRNNTLELMTNDHSLAQEKYARGELNIEEAKTHPSANILTRAVGIHKNLRLEIGHSAAQNGDRYLICSDGLYNDLDFNKIQSILPTKSLNTALDQLLNNALNQGGKDNITAIIVEAE